MKYNKPSELGTTEDLVKRFQAAKKQRSTWQTHLRECYEYALPQRNTMTQFSRGQKKNEDIYDSTAVVGTQKFASRLQATLIPPWREWSMLVPGSEIPEDEHEKIQPVLDDITKIIFDHINHSNFATQAHESFLDLAVSTGVLALEENDTAESALEFHSAPLAEIYPEAGPRGTIETVWREHKVPARHIDRLWPGAQLSETMKKKASERPDEKCSLIEGTIYLPKRGYWHQCVLEEASKEYIFGQDYDVSPWIVFREYVVPGETLGRGRIMQVLPDIKTANKVVEYVLKNAALAISGVYTAADDGVINPYSIRLTPGAIIPVGSNDNANPTLRPLDRSGDIQFSALVLDDLRKRINKALFAEPFGEVDSPVRSATEMAIRNQELVQDSGSAFGRMQTEFVEKIIKRAVSILKRAGKIPDIRVDGKEVTIKHTSPLARAQDQDDLVAVNQYLQTVGQLGPEVLGLGTKLEEFPGYIGKKLGLDADLLRTEVEREEMAQTAMQAEQTAA
ncbi:MAG: portal protein [Luminiphilus sp.]